MKKKNKQTMENHKFTKLDRNRRKINNVDLKQLVNTKI